MSLCVGSLSYSLSPLTPHSASGPPPPVPWGARLQLGQRESLGPCFLARWLTVQRFFPGTLQGVQITGVPPSPSGSAVNCGSGPFYLQDILAFGPTEAASSKVFTPAGSSPPNKDVDPGGTQSPPGDLLGPPWLQSSVFQKRPKFSSGASTSSHAPASCQLVWGYFPPPAGHFCKGLCTGKGRWGFLMH